ncbi:MAG TPA: LemA family protein [Kofleriaceae bacterium]|nr:LemA family protein [Kofleriaceae bacterium]
MRHGRISALSIIGIVAIVLGIATCSTYNKLVSADQTVQAQWAQVENVYQRRADLIPNLVATVKGAAEFEKSTLTAVTDARSRVGQAAPRGDVTSQPAKFAEYQQAQDQLGGALGRLLVVAEAYPTLTATQGFRDLQAQLEGTENRIAVERMRYNDAARAFNTTRSRFPTSLVASLFGGRFAAKTYFTAQAGAESVPQVRF